jgi:protein O-GlcNAc transferase
MNATARNAPCPCGSGKRYKNCHGAVGGDAEIAAKSVAIPEGDDARELLERGLALQQRGDTAQAQSCYERVLALDANHPDAWHLLALLDLANGRAAPALEKVRKAIATFPEHALYHVSLARVLLALERRDEAADAARHALDLDGAACEAWTLLGLAIARDEATEAIAAWRRAIAAQPQTTEAHFLLGNVLSESGRHAEAIAVYEQGLALEPENAQLLNNLGLALSRTGQDRDAEAAFRRAYSANHLLIEAQANLGELLYRRHRFAEAHPIIEAVLKNRPDVARLWIRLGDCQDRAGDTSAANESWRRAVSLQPQDAQLQIEIGTVLEDGGKIGEAIPYYREAALLDPLGRNTQIRLMLAEHKICDWSHHEELLREIDAALNAQPPVGVSPLACLQLLNSPELQLRAAQLAAPINTEPGPAALVALGREPGQRLRIGYLSSDLREHPVGLLMSEMLGLHDRSRCEVFAYSWGPPQDVSPENERIKRAVDHWHDITADTDEEAARRIRADRIHVLLDLNGHTSFSRMKILALRPAPVQVAYLGYAGTTGSTAYDYVLTDRYACPPEQQENFAERFLYLPHCFMPSDTQRLLRDTVPMRAACGLPQDGFVFCGFNNLAKLLPPVFDVWMRLLRAIPNSVLWLNAGPSIQHNLRREAEQRGVNADRFVFAPRVADIADHLTRHRAADLFLDTLPYNAHTTANDALYSGLPVLTCVGETFASRVAGSQLRAIGLPELITHSLADYEAMALRLARDRDLLGSLRARLAANRHTQPLFDMARFTRDFEDALERAWEERAAAHR